MDRISCGQFTALLFVTDAFALLCLMGNISVVTAVGMLTGIALQWLMAIPAVCLYKKNKKLKDANKIVLWVLLAYLVYWGGLLFVMLRNASGELSIAADRFPYIPEYLLVSALIAIVCLYSAAPGIKPLARASVIVAALGAVCIAVVVLSAVPRFSIDNLSDMRYADGFFYELSRGFVISGGLGSLIVLLGFTKCSPVRCVTVYFIEKAVLFAAVLLTVSASSGSIMEIADFPVIMSAELSQPFTSQRIDSLFLIVFAIMAVFSVAVQAATASCVMKLLFPSFRKFRTTLVLVLMLGAALVLYGVPQYNVIYAVVTGAVFIGVPLLCYKS